MISNHIWPVMWLFFRLNDMKMQRGFLKVWRIGMGQSLMLGCSILWYTHTAKLERSQNHKTCSERWRAWVFLCRQSHSIVWWLFKILFQMQRLVCGRWSLNYSLLVESAEPGSDFQACDKVESTLCLPLSCLQCLNIRCICNFTNNEAQ